VIKGNIVLILLLLLLFSSCSKAVFENQKKSIAYTKDFSKGPVSLEMDVDNVEISTAGQLNIVLRGKVVEGWKPSFPELSGDLGEFKILSVQDFPSRLAKDGSIELSRIISVQPFLSGNYEIPILGLNYTKEESKGTLFTTPVGITVTTLLPENTENLELKELKEPDTFNYNNLIIYLSASVLILIIGVLLFLFYRKRKRNRIIPKIAPSEEAFQKLSNLLTRNLPEEGRYKEFYYRLNLIVRVYIEKQFFLRAPEQTTEEFLQDLSVSKEIGGNFKQVLKEFLIHSDLVKFALLKPEEKDIERSVESCRNFIKVTGEKI
jgi:hypothetical protein